MAISIGHLMVTLLTVPFLHTTESAITDGTNGNANQLADIA